MGNGTHWMSLKIENKDCIYFDSYGMLPPNLDKIDWRYLSQN